MIKLERPSFISPRITIAGEDVCGESRRCKDAKKGPCLMAEKPEGKFLTKEGSSPERYKPKVGFWAG